MFRQLANLFSSRIAPTSLADDLESLKREREDHRIGSQTIPAAELLRRHPPQPEHAKKQLLFDTVLEGDMGLSGPVSASRYREIQVPANYQPFDTNTEVVARKGYFRYDDTEGTEDWFMNFAHHDLFHGYGHFMFAQDEIQVAEHPVLASFREMMLSRTDKLRPVTVEQGAPTPVLFRDVPRAANIDTRSIYGAHFARSDDATVRDTVQKIAPPTLSSILAIEAPISSGIRVYARCEIEAALRTAYSGFRSTILESITDGALVNPVVVHTGNWGCGAYGGNRQLMLMTQMVAAHLAGISRLVFYCGLDSKDDVARFNMELERRFKFQPGVAVGKVVDRLVAAAFPWGTPDGN